MLECKVPRRKPMEKGGGDMEETDWSDKNDNN